MCTVTWERSPEGYQLFCNRDERRTRKPAFPPRRFVRNGLVCVAPLDGEFGGSWIGVNEHGLTVCILNGFDRRGAQPATSRGQLVLEALGCRLVDEIGDMVHVRDLRPYRSFALLGVPARGDARAFIWDGQSLKELRDAEKLQPFTSSSFRSDEVITCRSQLFQASQLRGEEFHSSHIGGPGPHSVCMHRSDAETVSFTKVRVSGSSISMGYSPKPPCAGTSLEEVLL